MASTKFRCFAITLIVWCWWWLKSPSQMWSVMKTTLLIETSHAPNFWQTLLQKICAEGDLFELGLGNAAHDFYRWQMYLPIAVCPEVVLPDSVYPIVRLETTSRTLLCQHVVLRMYKKELLIFTAVFHMTMCSLLVVLSRLASATHVAPAVHCVRTIHPKSWLAWGLPKRTGRYLRAVCSRSRLMFGHMRRHLALWYRQGLVQCLSPLDCGILERQLEAFGLWYWRHSRMKRHWIEVQLGLLSGIDGL